MEKVGAFFAWSLILLKKNNTCEKIDFMTLFINYKNNLYATAALMNQKRQQTNA